MLVQPGDFTGEILIADRLKDGTRQELQAFIDKYEKKYLGILLGPDVYPGVPVIDFSLPPWSLAANETALKTAIANYVYFFFMRNLHETADSTGINLPQQENSRRGSYNAKMTRAWNEMAEIGQDVVTYLKARPGVYPGFTPYSLRRAYRTEEIFKTINLLNL